MQATNNWVLLICFISIMAFGRVVKWLIDKEEEKPKQNTGDDFGGWDNLMDKDFNKN